MNNENKKPGRPKSPVGDSLNYPHTSFDVEIYEAYGGQNWAQGKYLVHGNDTYWCNDIEGVLQAIKQSLEAIE